jgi:hypothetical protein
MIDGRALITEDVLRNGSDLPYNEMLTWLYAHYSPAILTPLLTSKIEKVLIDGLFFAEELGHRASPNVQEIADLCQHPSINVRLKAIHALAPCVTESRSEYLNPLFISAINDQDQRCRVAACFELMRIPQRILEGFVCQKLLQSADTDNVTTLLHQHGKAATRRELIEALNHGSRARRVMELILTVRSDEQLLESGLANDEVDVQLTSKLMLTFLSLRLRRRPSE